MTLKEKQNFVSDNRDATYGRKNILVLLFTCTATEKSKKTKLFHAVPQNIIANCSFQLEAAILLISF